MVWAMILRLGLAKLDQNTWGQKDGEWIKRLSLKQKIAALERDLSCNFIAGFSMFACSLNCLSMESY